MTSVENICYLPYQALQAGVQGGHHALGAEKSQQVRKYILQYNTFASVRPEGESGGAKLISCPGAI